MNFEHIDRLVINKMRLLGLPLLRISLGIVFLWFGLLKVAGVSPVSVMILAVYNIPSQNSFIIFLGVFEMLVGLGLLLKIWLRLTLLLFFGQMAGIFLSLILRPDIFFQTNPFLLTFDGEFVIKNIVLISAAIVIGGYDVKPKLEL